MNVLAVFVRAFFGWITDDWNTQNARYYEQLDLEPAEHVAETVQINGDRL
jgi:hypothetical protein